MGDLENNIKYKDGFFRGNNNIDIYYRQYKVKNSKGIIVISHGFCESIEKYEELIKIFNENNYSVFGLDHRGHGKSGRLGIDNSQIHVEKFYYYVEDMKIFLDKIVTSEINNEKLFLFSHSMGGAIGALFLEKYSDYFDCAILSCPMMEINLGKYPLLVSKFVSNIMCSIGKGKTYILGHKSFTTVSNLEKSGTSCERRYNNYFEKQLKFEYLRASGASFRWLKESFIAIEKLMKIKNIMKIKVPVLLFQAGKDLFVNPKNQNIFAKYAVNCKLIRVENSKHEIYMERDEILKPYLKKVIGFYNENLND